MRYIRGNVERIAKTDAQAEKLKKNGFKPVAMAEAAETSTKEVTAPEAPDLDAMTVLELKTLAKDKGIAGASSLNKAELLEMLKDVV